jgi:hypothetical protein
MPRKYGHKWRGVLKLRWVAESKGQQNECFKLKECELRTQNSQIVEKMWILPS